MIAERSSRGNDFSRTLESFLAFCRWSSALVVVFSHARALSFVGYHQLSGWPAKLILPLYVIGAMANEAVIIFFVLSGFLVGGRAAERALGGRFRLLDYGTDRVTRIYGVLIPALALTYTFDLFGDRWFGASGMYDRGSELISGRFAVPFRSAHRLSVLLCNLVGGQPHHCPTFGSNVPLWSLSYEIWFYICAGAICFAYQRRARIGAAIAAASLTGMVIALGWSSLVYGAIWVGGAVIYLISRGAPNLGRNGVISATAAGGLAIVGFSRIPVAIIVDQKAFAVSLIGTAATFGLILYLWCGLKVKASESWRTFNLAVSEFSYSLYVIHFPTVVLTLSMLIVLSGGRVGPRAGFQPTDLPTLAAFLLAICISVIVAFCFSRVFEKGSLRVRYILKQSITRSSPA